jgi:drug/metabolite transporter (DMT)-like permease
VIITKREKPNERRFGLSILMAKLAIRQNQDLPMLGIALMLAAYFFFSFIDTSAKWLSLAGLPALQLAFMRYFGHFVISVGIIARGGVSGERFGAEHLGLVIFRGALLAFSTILNFIAIRYIPLTLTSTILFSSPIIICALSGPLLGERVGIWRWSAIILGFFGIVIAIRPFDESFHWAVFLSLTGAMCFAIYSILTRKLSGVVATDTMQFYSGLVGTVALAPFALANWVNPDNMLNWVILFMMGFFGWLGHELLTRAHGFAPAATLTPYGYSFIIFLTVWSYFLFEHLPDRWTVLGAIVIVTAGMVIWFRERQQNGRRREAVAGS